MKNSKTNANKEKSIVFLHIPKAAGSTLNTIIKREYEPESIYSTNKWSGVQEAIAEFKILPEARRKEIKVLQGHMKFGIHEYLPQPSTYITILRDPIERIISHYYYVLRNPRHYLYNEVTSKNISLEDYVGSGISIELNNAQTRILAGVETVDFGKCSPEILDTAKRNMREHFAVVGLTEKFDETLLLLKRAFEWKNTFYTKANVSKNRPLKEAVSKDTLKLIGKYNELDIELYKYVEEMFKELINQSANFSKMELRQFKLINGIYSKAYPYYHKVVNKAKSLGVTE